MNNPNPILDELHAVREKLLAEAGGMLDGLVARIQAEQKSSGRVIPEVLSKSPITGTTKSNESSVNQSSSAIVNP